MLRRSVKVCRPEASPIAAGLVTLIIVASFFAFLMLGLHADLNRTVVGVGKHTESDAVRIIYVYKFLLAGFASRDSNFVALLTRLRRAVEGDEV